MFKDILDKLGITYDQSHGYIAGFSIPIISIAFFRMLYGLQWGDQITALVAVGIALFMVVTLQLINEYAQAMDKDVEEKYGSWKNFQKNSRVDWKYMVLGSMAGVFIAFLMIVIIISSGRAI